MNIVAFSGKDKVLVEFMRHKLEHDDYWLEIAMRMLYERQTNDEKSIRTTIYKNMSGFNKPDARAVADIIVRYLLGVMSNTDKGTLKKLLPKYAIQLFKRTNQKVKDKLETELSNPITRAGFKLTPEMENLVHDRGEYNREEQLGQDPSIVKRAPGRIFVNSKVAKELVRIAKLLEG
jgi:hypothetical protein